MVGRPLIAVDFRWTHTSASNSTDIGFGASNGFQRLAGLVPSHRGVLLLVCSTRNVPVERLAYLQDRLERNQLDRHTRNRHLLGTGIYKQHHQLASS